MYHRQVQGFGEDSLPPPTALRIRFIAESPRWRGVGTSDSELASEGTDTSSSIGCGAIGVTESDTAGALAAGAGAGPETIARDWSAAAKPEDAGAAMAGGGVVVLGCAPSVCRAAGAGRAGAARETALAELFGSTGGSAGRSATAGIGVSAVGEYAARAA